MTYARSRLLLGITGVGFWVVLSSLFFVFDVSKLFNAYSIYKVIPSAIGLYGLLSFPFDVTGGYILPKRYGRWPHTFQRWFLGWLKGLVVQAGFLYLLSLVLWQGLSTFNLLGQLMVLVGLQLLLAFFQPLLAYLIGTMKTVTSSQNRQVWQSNDIGFTGGVSLTGQAIMPEKWTLSLSEAQLNWMVHRRALLVKHSMNLSSVLTAVAFNTLGFVVVSKGLHLEFAQAGSWLTLVTGSTLWSFLGVLVLPSLSQRAILVLDSASSSSLSTLEQEEVCQAIRQLDSWQDEEPVRHKWVQSIFHPLPSVQQRQAVIARPQSTSGFVMWHVARRALYYSWPLMNLLNRAVHCNAGRPDLWVFLPSEG